MSKQDPDDILAREKMKARRPSYVDDEPHGFDLLDPVEEKKLVRKLDMHIVPVCMLLYLLSFLDRFVPLFLRVEV